MTYKFILIGNLVSLFLLWSCKSDVYRDISSELGIDVSRGSEIYNYDSHSGNGDGCCYVILQFRNNELVDEIAKDSRWRNFPLDRTAQTLVYGVKVSSGCNGPYLVDDRGVALIPNISNGYYILIDRHEQEGLDLLNRFSYNFTIGLYDIESNRLYFCRFDS